MNKTTVLVLAGFLVLLGAVLAVQYWPKERLAEGLHLAGWSDRPEDQKPANRPPTFPFDEEKGAKAEESPVDKIEIVRKGQKVVLERETGSDKKIWKITAPRAAAADWNRIKPLLERFRNPTDAVYAKKVAADQLALYKLDAPQRIGLRLFKNGAVWVDLIVGASETARAEPGAEEAPAQTDTFVMRPGDDLVYRIAGKDLRSVADVELSSLRSKKLFTFDKSDVSQVMLENAADTEHPRIVLKRVVAEAPSDPTPSADETGMGDNSKKDSDEWEFVEPSGFVAGKLSPLLSSIASVYASDFLDPDHAEYANAKTALAKQPYKINLTLPKETLSLSVSEPDEKNGYLQVAGSDEIVKVSKYTAKNLRKELGDLREKKVLHLTKEEITRVEMLGTKTVIVEKRNGKWQFVEPPGPEIGEKPMSTLLSDIVGIAATSFLGSRPPNETGLSQPAQRLVIKAGQTSHSLLFGREDQSKVYAALEGSVEVFQVSSYAVKKLFLSPDDLQNKQIFTFKSEEVVQLELKHLDETVRLQRDSTNVEKWTMTAPKAMDEPRKAAINGILNTLANLSAKKFVPNKNTVDTGLDPAKAFSVIATLKDGSTHTLWISDQLDDKDPYARTDETPWSQTIFTLNAFQSQALRKRPKDFEEAANPSGVPGIAPLPSMP